MYSYLISVEYTRVDGELTPGHVHRPPQGSGVGGRVALSEFNDRPLRTTATNYREREGDRTKIYNERGRGGGGGEGKDQGRKKRGGGVLTKGVAGVLLSCMAEVVRP